MGRSLSILHITDCHLVADPRGHLHDWPVAAAFDHVLCRALERYPAADAIVLGGDLVDDESLAGYRWLAQRMAGCNKPVLALAGNHDDPNAMARVLEPIVVHGVLSLGDWRLIGLCSHRPGREDGHVGETALAELDQRLSRDRSPTLLCIHHPPLIVGCAWIDAIGLVDAARLRALIARHAHVRGVIGGHVHQACEQRIHNRPAWTTPSTMRQFLPNSTEFATDSRRSPGYRWLGLASDGSISSRVHRCDNTPGPKPR